MRCSRRRSLAGEGLHSRRALRSCRWRSGERFESPCEARKQIEVQVQVQAAAQKLILVEHTCIPSNKRLEKCMSSRTKYEYIEIESEWQEH